MRIRALAAAAVVLAVAVPTHTAEAKLKPTRQVLTVGNNWDGTADLIDPRRFTRLTRINIVPDLAERMAEIQADPVRYGYFLAIRQEIGEGHDQLVDDAFTSLDGRYLYVSRPSLADVVAISLKTRKIVWRTPVEGNRSDHMALSPDGTRLLVSATPASAASSRRSTTRSSTPPRGTAGSRSSMRRRCRSSSASRWATSSPRPATRT